MGYIGPSPNPGQNREVDDISSGFNGGTASFTLQVNGQNVSPGSANAIIVSLGGVVQNPGTDYTIAASTITFTTNPASGLSFFGLVLGQGIDSQTIADGQSPTMAAPSITGDLSIADKIVHTGDTNTAIRFPAADTITAETSGSERLRVDSSGRFLIGTTSYKSNLNNSADSSGQISQFHHAGDNINGCLSVFAYSGSTSPTTRGCKLQLHRARSSDGSTNTILSNGDLIGSVDFKGNDGTSFTLSSKIEAFVDGGTGTDDMPGRLVFSTSADGSGAPTERMRLDSSGRLLLGLTSTVGPTEGIFYLKGNTGSSGSISVFQSNGNALGGRDFIRFLNQSGGEAGSIEHNNENSVSFNTSSDYRLKENEVLISDGITRLKTLKPYRFNWKSNSSTIVDGFFAHEVSDAVPEAISGTKDQTQDILYTESDTIPSDKKVGDVKETVPDYQQIDQSKLVPLLTAALQEAVTKIETLETKVAALEAA